MQPHLAQPRTNRPIAPATPHATLSTLHNGRVCVLYSCATQNLRQPTPAAPAARTQSYSVLTHSSWIYRQNNVPKYQAYFQKNDGLRTWEKVRAT